MATAAIPLGRKPPSKLSHEAAILEVLQRLPPPGGPKIVYQDLETLSLGSNGIEPIDWDSMPRSCDPVFVLDNPANNTRRRGNLDQQLAQMVLGRPEEVAPEVAVAAAQRPSTGRSRGMVKRWQVESFAAVLRRLLPPPPPASPSSSSQPEPRPPHVVDFGCGTGTLLLPLAVLFPHCRFTGIEMKPAAVALLQERARAAALPNVTAQRCMIETFLQQPFDVALALHACGNATDAALQLAVRRRAAYVVSPCCVGKLKFSLAGGSSFSTHHTAYTPCMPGDKPSARTRPQQPPSSTKQPAAATTTAQQETAGPGASAAAAGADADADAASGAQVAPAEAGAAGDAAGSAPEAVRDAGTAVVAVAGLVGNHDPGARRGGGEGGERGEAGGEGSGGGGGAVELGEVRHPRSHWLRTRLPDPEHNFRIMAKVADQNHSGEAAASLEDGSLDGETSIAAAAARACKAHVELDRNLAASEEGYAVGLFKCFQWQLMAKNDLLVGVPSERTEWAGLVNQLARLEDA
ncbi:hypothetical protein Agub_g1400 [Astrephomene gubernaculifera]|uniref:Methyltransferase domain-containing protein n=1 Tax=Astrephomene gubernaculifera TaxID=47775 RepID=A0AAD3DFD3_9CHLO|nr:hypothetical protein Agub_g1400 [Astrephomene gubernaculifera]